MNPEREWGKRYYCFTCKKDLTEEFFNSHMALGHLGEIYKTMPREIERRIEPKEEKPEILKSIKEDYADIEESEPEVEFLE